ncbi:hypothetical protein [Mycolicibacterium porcinum]|uniref:Uncharacterized protein n=1 Tax=Mycolicibacterium porcinum TaxID=39693 RepID=A0ABV3VP40_9MYCO
MTLVVRRFVVGSAIAAAACCAGMIAAGTAAAAPGISYDGGPGDPVGIGDHDNTVVAINGTATVHGEWTNVVAVGSKVSNRPIVTYPDGSHAFAYRGPAATFPVIVPSSVVVVCGQRITGSDDIFETSGNITCRQ